MAIDYAPLDEEEDRIQPEAIIPQGSGPRGRAPIAAQPAPIRIRIPKFLENDATECNYLVIAFVVGALFILKK